MSLEADTTEDLSVPIKEYPSAEFNWLPAMIVESLFSMDELVSVAAKTVMFLARGSSCFFNFLYSLALSKLIAILFA